LDGPDREQGTCLQDNGLPAPAGAGEKRARCLPSC